MTKVFVFDFDGVIVDSLPIRDEGFRYAFLPYGEKLAIEAKNYHVNNRGIFRLNKYKLIYKEIIGINANDDQLIATEKRFCEYVFEKLNQVELLKKRAEIRLFQTIYAARVTVTLDKMA